MEFDGNLVKLTIAIIGFVLGVAGLGLFLIKIFFGRVFAAIKTLFDAKENLEHRFLETEKRIQRVEQIVLITNPDNTMVSKAMLESTLPPRPRKK